MLFTLSPAHAEQPDLIVDEVKRSIHLLEYGLIITNDTYTISNVGQDVVFHVLAAIPLELEEQLQFFQAESEDGAVLLTQRVPLIGTNCTGWKVYLPEPVMPGRSFEYKTVMVFEGLTRLDVEGVTCDVSPFPTSPYFISSCDALFTHYTGVSSPSESSFEFADIDPYSYQPTNISLEIDAGRGIPLMSYIQLERQYTIDPWGYLQVLETHTLELDSINPGDNWRSISTTLLIGSENIKAYDSISNLTTTIVIEGNQTRQTVISVQFQYFPEFGDIYQFCIEYRCPLDYYQTISQNVFFLNINPYFNHPWIIRHQITEFVLPAEAYLLSIPAGAEITTSVSGQYLVKFHDYNVSRFYNPEISFNYVYPAQPAYQRPMIFALVLSVICLAYVAARRVPIFREEEIVTARAEIDPALLSDFCALYGEKIALLLQTERLEKSMLAQKISKPRYRKERKIFERKLRTLERDIQGRARPLIEAGGKYESSIRQLELLEAERVSSIEALRALEQRYKQKRVTSTVYQKLRADLEKRRDKATSGMDRVLIDLREEITSSKGI